jgi:ubiquinone/menaquinone biosynthesis C-methylase UbiE
MNRTVAHHVCYGLARAFLRPPMNRFGFRRPSITRYDSVQEYEKDRTATVAEYLALFSPFVSFKDKTVLDLGCSSGYLLESFLSHEAFTPIGADISSDVLDQARQRYGTSMRFVQTTASSLPIESESIDIVYSVDTVEHLSRPKDMFQEIYRVLKPGGRALIHFGPFRNPYGSHMEDIIPFPWPHVLFSMKTLLGVAARLYDSPYSQVACYSIDQRTGLKKPNPYLDEGRWETFLNHITIRGFNQVLKELPFRVVHQERIGFGGRTFRIGRLVRFLAKVPFVDDFFCSALYTVLEKPTGSSERRERRKAGRFERLLKP